MSLPLNQLHPRSISARIGAMMSPIPKLDSRSSRVLFYHGITQRRPIALNTRFVSVHRLRRDIHVLRRIPGLRFVTLADAMDPECPGPKVALTFDDGYAGMRYTLLPVLEAEGVPATVFVTTLDADVASQGFRRMLWADRIDLAAYKGHPDFVIGQDRFTLDRRKIWRRAHDGQLLKSLCINSDAAFLRAVAAACDPGEGLEPYWKLLAQDDLRYLAAHPLISLGAHGITHANLPSIKPEERWTELTGSKIWLENCIQKEVTSFAYPHGQYTPECVQQARRAGYTVQALMEYQSQQDADAPDLCNRIGNHPRCGSLVQRRVIAQGGYGHERIS